jgi:murein DD-endopeptidase MepM/ murein hydrolase activator NlpD
MRIDAGKIVGYVGNTGNAITTPPHLHYGIYTAGGAINPYPLLKAGSA